jgi:hypothetical protein
MAIVARVTRVVAKAGARVCAKKQQSAISALGQVEFVYLLQFALDDLDYPSHRV